MAGEIEKAPRKSKVKPRQAVLEGMEAKKIKRLTDLGLEYNEKKEERMAVLKEEVELKASLLAEMAKHKLTHYADPDVDLVVDLEETEVKLKVKVGKHEDGGGD